MSNKVYDLGYERSQGQAQEEETIRTAKTSGLEPTVKRRCNGFWDQGNPCPLLIDWSETTEIDS